MPRIEINGAELEIREIGSGSLSCLSTAAWVMNAPLWLRSGFSPTTIV